MGRFSTLGIVLFVVIAFGVVLAESASAVTFLSAEWLFIGAKVETELPVEMIGELELIDEKTPIGEVAVKCSVKLDGAINGPVESGGVGLVNELLSLAGTATGNGLLGTELTCTNIKNCPGEQRAWQVGMGWNGSLELMEEENKSFFVDLLKEGSGAKKPGWEIECTGGMFNDTCEASLLIGEINNGANEEIVFSREFNELSGTGFATCSLGGASAGRIVGKLLIQHTTGGAITASSL